MPSQADLAAAFARMRQNNSDAGSGIRNGAIDLGNVYGRNLGNAPSVLPPTFGGKGSDSSGEPLWLKALTGLFSPGKAVTNQFANWSDKKFDWKDIPLADSIMQGAKAQVHDWRDGDFSWGDVPGFGFLHGVGDQGQGFGKTLTNLGAKPGGYLEKIGGLEGDVLFDPLNLVTFGAGSAIKAGAKASQIAAKGLAKEAGLSGKIAAQKLPGAIGDAITARHAGSAIDPRIVDRLASKEAAAAQKIIDNAGKAARNKAQNAVLNFDLPFTNVTKQYGQKANIPLVGKYLHKSDAKIGATGAAAVADAFTKIGLDLTNPEHAKQMQGILKSTYGVDDAADITTQGLKHLQDAVDNFTSKFTANDGKAKNFLNGHNIEEVMQQIKNPKYNPKIDPNLHIGAYEEPFLDNLSRTVTDKPFDLNTGDEFLKTLDNHVQDMGGKSALGRAVAKVNPFDARAFRSSDVLASQSANAVRDATTKINGQTRQANEQIAGVEKVMQGLSDAEKRAVIYETQKHYPKGFDKSSIDTAKVQEASSKVKAIMDQIGQRDLAAGGIKELRSNYFPHVLKKDGVDINALTQDPDIAKILGMSRSNNFGKSREGFQTIAQLDEVVAGLEKAAAANPAKAEKLLEKAEELRNLFDTNVTSALGTRAYKSVRSSSYAGLFKQLEKDGLMARPSTKLSETKVHADSNPESFHKLNADEAKVLGVEPGTMIHKDTFEGLQRVQDLFTVKGANKLLENINNVVSIWKSLVTSYIPAHYFNNFIGNVANNTLAGVKPESYKAASDILKSMKSGNVSPEDMKIVQAAFDKGVFGSGFSSDFVKSQFKSGKKPFADKIQNNAWTKFLRKYGENGDDLARMALFSHGLKQTGSTDKAAEMVRKYLFNYSERSHGDTITRSVAPFWMWTKNNLPLQIQSFMQQPRYYATYKKIKDAFNADVEGGQNKQYTTDNYLHLPGTNVGLSLNSLPMNNLNMFGTGALDTLRSTLGMAAPPFKAPAELGLNRQFFNNAPVYYEDNKAAGIGKYLLNQTGAVGKAVNIADGQGNTLLEILGGIIGKPVEYK